MFDLLIEIIVNWCNHLSDVILDDELNHENIEDPLIMVEFWEYKRAWNFTIRRR